MTRPTAFVPIVLFLGLLIAPAPNAQSPPHAPDRYATLPAVSPDGRRVAYVRDPGDGGSELRLVGLDGSGDRRLWSWARGGGVPGWMPGGRRVTFVATRGDSVTMWSVPIDGGEPRIEQRRRGKSLSLSHDGRRLASMVGGWRSGVLMVTDLRTGRSRALSDSTAGWFNIAWSPNDRTLAASHLGAGGAMEVWGVDVESGRHRVLAAFDSTRGRPQWPTWSPDGKRIVVQAGRRDREHPGSDVADLWIVDVASGAATRVGTRSGTWMDETPSWCPDGRRIVFQSSRSGRFEIWCANADGTRARSLTP